MFLFFSRCISNGSLIPAVAARFAGSVAAFEANVAVVVDHVAAAVLVKPETIKISQTFQPSWRGSNTMVKW